MLNRVRNSFENRAGGIRKRAEREGECPVSHIQDIRRRSAICVDLFTSEDYSDSEVDEVPGASEISKTNRHMAGWALKKSKEGGGFGVQGAELNGREEEFLDQVTRIGTQVEFLVSVQDRRHRENQVWVDELAEFMDGRPNPQIPSCRDCCPALSPL